MSALTPQEQALAEKVSKDASVTTKLLLRYRSEWDRDLARKKPA